MRPMPSCPSSRLCFEARVRWMRGRRARQVVRCKVRCGLAQNCCERLRDLAYCSARNSSKFGNFDKPKCLMVWEQSARASFAISSQWEGISWIPELGLICYITEKSIVGRGSKRPAWISKLFIERLLFFHQDTVKRIWILCRTLIDPKKVNI